MTFQLFLYIWIIAAICTFISLFFVSAPYGRHARKGWGLMIDNRLGWILMEIVSPAVFAFFFLSGSQSKTPIVWIFFAAWLFHYINRSMIFPFRIKTQGKKMPLSIPLMAVFFNSVNGFTNGYYLGSLAVYPENWLTDIRFIVGIILFLVGWFINFQSDEILLNLRKPGESGYKIPKGGFFRFISCPNYFGEIIEWSGFAIMTWSLPGLAFAVWTFANLAPRAFANHNWYQNQFTDYPKERKALLPFLI